MHCRILLRSKHLDLFKVHLCTTILLHSFILSSETWLFVGTQFKQIWWMTPLMCRLYGPCFYHYDIVPPVPALAVHTSHSAWWRWRTRYGRWWSSQQQFQSLSTVPGYFECHISAPPRTSQIDWAQLVPHSKENSRRRVQGSHFWITPATIKMGFACWILCPP